MYPLIIVTNNSKYDIIQYQPILPVFLTRSYNPAIPQTVIAMLACARIGAIHSVVFGGFSSEELATRIDDCEPKVIVSASGGIDGKKLVPYKPLLDRAIDLAKHKPEKCIIFQVEIIVFVVFITIFLLL